MHIRGFRTNTKAHDLRLKEIAVSVVSREARGFLLAGFFGGVCGGFCASCFAFGVGAFFF